MDLEAVRQEAKRLGMWAHVATVAPDGSPDVTPVHPCWDGDTLWSMVGTASKKARNLAQNANVAVHYQVSETTNFDSLILWGTGKVHDDVETKKRLWTGVFDYDLSAFAPGGPENSEGTAFLEITPTKAVLLRMYGMQGREEWHA